MRDPMAVWAAVYLALLAVGGLALLLGLFGAVRWFLA